MKAIVLGGGGILGLSLLVYLKHQKDITEVLVTDIQEKVIKERVAWLNDGRFMVKEVDASDCNALARAIKGYDIVLNVSRIRDKTVAMKGALEASAHYVDCGVEQIDEKLSLDEDFRKKGLVAVFDMYFSPGLHNILAAYAVKQLDRVESVDFRWAVVDIVPASEHSRKLYGGFSLGGYILHHYTRSSKRWENGRMMDLPPRADPETFTFKGPIGTVEVAGLPGDSMCDLARVRPDIPSISFKEALGAETDRSCQLLVALGFNQEEPINIDGQSVSPWAMLQMLANNQPPEIKKAPDIRHGGCAIVRGVKGGQTVEYHVEAWPSESLVQKHKDMGCARYGGPGGVFRCGSPMGSLAVLIGRGQIRSSGAFLPEAVVPAKEFLDQEVSMGLNVEVTRTEIL